MKPTLVFAGTPEIAADVLQTLLDAGYPIKAVFTQPDRPAGRGKLPTASPVKVLALSHHIPVHEPERFNKAAQATLSALQPDYLIVVAYGLILPKAALSIPHKAALNIHTSLLPRYRGAAPAQRALLAGDIITGVTLMQMDAGLDTGPMLIQTETPIQSQETAGELITRLGQLGAEALLSYLKSPHDYPPIPQTDRLASYAHKLTVEEAEIDWTQPAEVIERAIRGYQPWPVAYTQWQDWRVRLLKSITVPSLSHSALPGTVLAFSPKGLVVQTGAGALCITQLQLPGKKPMDTAALYNGYAKHFAVGQHFG